MKEWLIEHLAEGLAAASVAIVGFFGRRELQRIDKSHAKNSQQIEAIDGRVGALERNYVTRGDFDELRGSLTASIVNVGERLEARLAEQNVQRTEQTNQLREDQRIVLQHLLAMKERK